MDDENIETGRCSPKKPSISLVQKVCARASRNSFQLSNVLLLLLSMALFFYGGYTLAGTYKTPNAGMNTHIEAKDGGLELMENSEMVQLPSFNATSEHRKWCPFAPCEKSVNCEPCRRRFLVLIATGRSGSTSLMNMLDFLPGVRMGGENNNTLHALNTLMETFNLEHENWQDRSGAWKHGALSRASLSCAAQSFIEAITPPPKGREDIDDSSTIIGWKTIRFFDDWENDVDAAKFLMETFPCARVVINLRANTDEQSKSAWYETTDDAKQMLDDLNKRHFAIAEQFGSRRAHIMNIDEWKQPGGTSKLNDLVSWLGFEGCTFPSTVHDNDRNESDGYKISGTKFSLGENCHYVGSAFSDFTAKEVAGNKLSGASSSEPANPRVCEEWCELHALGW
eukprot:CAMPEP_0195510866 /NCGR_PEP_ID=MMETSP0794_2-20130614/3384_1 /TAXON_ID=515487 /ORGANISM="Stephanopyxis turris, Strain CCMP 815" /LENGTH=395 /DNA_ID=CAMNT_0040638373 /DNA_START=132 /DNA_END=1316 /DNA_ORIENTATION=+